MDPQTRRRGTHDSIKRILLRESLNQPLMVIFEDLHWIDEGTQAFLNLFADSIGTAKILLLVNYRPEYSHHWNSKTYYTQLRLDPLGKESADQMLSALLGDGEDLAPLKRLIIERTEGNPFFLEETVLVLFDEGALVRNGAVKLTRPPNQLKIPPTVQAILAARIDRLAPGHKDLLQTLLVIGTEFKVGLVRKVAEKPGPELEPMLFELQLGEFIYEQPAVGDVEYIFKHALTHDVAYQSVLNERRRMLHGRIGPALESMYAANLDEHVAELAHHYARSANPRKAVEYCMRAVGQCAVRGARAEALAQFETGLEQLGKLPNDDQRAELELDLRNAAYGALFVIEGYGSLEMEQSSARALELCRLPGISSEKRLAALTSFFNFQLTRGDMRKASEIVPDMIALAEEHASAPQVVDAIFSMGFVRIHSGDFELAAPDLDRSMALTESIAASPNQRRVKLSPGDTWVYLFNRMLIPIISAWNQWFLGYPDRALKQVSIGTAFARDSEIKTIRATGLSFAATLYGLRRELEPMREQAQAALELATELGSSLSRAMSEINLGWADAMAGDLEGGIARMRHRLSAVRSTGSEVGSVGTLAHIADALRLTGRFDEGLRSVDESFPIIERTGERMFEAEVRRVKGELLLARDASNAAQAERSFCTAIEVARRQKAKSWELRATTSLARLLAKQDKRDEARAMLADIYNWFTEGFDTADLRDAKALLDELGT